MKNFSDRLFEKMDYVENAVCVGLDPRIKLIPSEIKKEVAQKTGLDKKLYGLMNLPSKKGDNSWALVEQMQQAKEVLFDAVAESFFQFNKRIIDATKDLVAVYKPQTAFYEAYQGPGIRALARTFAYIKHVGRICIEDAKRGDISETAEAYSRGHLGTVELSEEFITPLGSSLPSFDVDAITVNTYLGSDGIIPFLADCKQHGKGIIALVKTSNLSSNEFQNRRFDKQFGGRLAYEDVGLHVDLWGRDLVGESKYSSVGAVMGATFPEEMMNMRRKLYSTPFLIPGYKIQGATPEDVVHGFNKDGLGAVINSSRGIIFAYLDEDYQRMFKPEEFDKASKFATEEMIRDINTELANVGKLRWSKSV